jgi:hydroxyquinol 1,2-dioxygenase
MAETDETTTPEDITDAVVASFDGCRDPRLREIATALVRHLHAFALEVGLSGEEWLAGIRFLTEAGHITDDVRQEFILLSDTLGFSMLVDAIAHERRQGGTESTVLGPFWVSGSPERGYGESIVEEPSGEPAWVHGRVLDPDGNPIPEAKLDVWQNGDDMLYQVQKSDGNPGNLRGVFTTRDDGAFAFVAVRPTDYTIPDDGPVGRMLAATGRHPWRPAHLHTIVSAPGFETLVTHVFDSESTYLDSDAVFGVKPSLVRRFVPRAADDQARPAGVEGAWYSLETDFVLVPSASRQP